MALRYLPAAERRASPWKNGGGVTIEIAAGPPGASLTDFDWRVSLAYVRSDGAFSHFPGVDRITIVLEGTLAVAVEGRPAVQLNPGDPPFSYPGDVSCYGSIGDRPARDLNVMTRRSRFSARVSHITDATTLPPCSPSDTLLLFADRPVRIDDSDGALSLSTGDAAIFGNADGAAPRVLIGPQIDCYLIALRKLA